MAKVGRQLLNIFYAESDEDRWLPFDRYPRRAFRRVLRGKPRPGGQARVFLNLCAGFDRIGVQYRINDYRHAKRNPSEVACIIGKPCVLDRFDWKNPILFGAATHSHPLDDPKLLVRLPIKKILVPGPWMKDMCKPYWGNAVEAWPVGIDTEAWNTSDLKEIDVLLYNKVRWEHDRYERELIAPIRAMLTRNGRSFLEMRYGSYREEDFSAALRRCRTMVFLCEHETQGIAYQQALSCNVPIFAWDRGGYWQDPNYYPHKVKFKPTTSVPYWDERCGKRFRDVGEFTGGWQEFWECVETEQFAPRDFMLENLTLEKSARKYLDLLQSI